MKILYVTTIGSTMKFFVSLIKDLIEQGNTVDIATNETVRPVPEIFRNLGCRVYSISCFRNPLDTGNVKAVKSINKIVEEGNYDIVHCHTPIASACTRVACKSLRKKGIKVIYTSHGFHFYKGAPLMNWLIYYPIERICAHWTDVLITINKEDYEIAKKKFKVEKVEYVSGVGIDVGKFANTVVDVAAKRREIGIPEDAFLLLSAGELNENKNHQIVIRALAELKDSTIHYMIAGCGPLKDNLQNLAQKLHIENQVHLLGYRDDLAELYKVADVDVFPSIREGLGLVAVEGMAAGLPLICSDNRGTREYAVQNENAIICKHDSVLDFSDAIFRLRCSRNDVIQLGQNGKKTALQFAVSSVSSRIQSLYSRSVGFNE